VYFKPFTESIKSATDIAKFFINSTDYLVDVSDCGHFLTTAYFYDFISIFLFMSLHHKGMETQSIILITVIANMLVQPVIQYLLHSRCSKVKCCFGCIDLERSVLEEKEKDEDEQKV